MPCLASLRTRQKIGPFPLSSSHLHACEATTAHFALCVTLFLSLIARLCNAIAHPCHRLSLPSSVPVIVAPLPLLTIARHRQHLRFHPRFTITSHASCVLVNSRMQPQISYSPFPVRLLVLAKAIVVMRGGKCGRKRRDGDFEHEFESVLKLGRSAWDVMLLLQLMDTKAICTVKWPVEKELNASMRDTAYERTQR